MGERNNLAVHPTYSSPELNTEQLRQQEHFAANEFTTQEALAYQFRPPPPYPRTSSSTPDLPGQAGGVRQVTEPSMMEGPAGPHSLISQSRLDGSVEDLSMFQNLQIDSRFPTGTEAHKSGMPAPPAFDGSSRPAVFNLANGSTVDRVAETTTHLTDTSNTEVNTAVMSIKTAEDVTTQRTPANDIPGLTPAGSKTMSDDQEDSSSEHSYSTFHVQDSDDSSEDDTLKRRDQSKIHIRMLTPSEAPPPSKIKEEATLRESFRRLKIARVGSLNRELPPSVHRSSLRGLKEATETDTLTPSVLRMVSEHQSREPSPLSGIASASSGTADISHCPASNATPVQTTEMKEILERLGAPPPYPGSQPGNNQYNSFPVNSNVTIGAMVPANNTDSSVLHQPVSNSQQTPVGPPPMLSTVTVKRSSSVGTAPLREPPVLPPRREELVKPRSSTYSLDTKVPVSKPGMVLLNNKGISIIDFVANLMMAVT